MITRLPVATAFDNRYLLGNRPEAADAQLYGMALAYGRSPLIELHLNVNFSRCAYRQRARDQENVVFGGRLGSDK
jgi:UDP-galactopyranose mutase